MNNVACVYCGFYHFTCHVLVLARFLCRKELCTCGYGLGMDNRPAGMGIQPTSLTVALLPETVTIKLSRFTFAQF